MIVASSSQLLQPPGVRRGEVAGVFQRGTAPQGQGLLNVPVGDEPLEAQRVHVIRRDRQPVPGRRLLDGGRAAQGAAGARYEGLQGVGQVRRRLIAPDRLGERGGAHRLAAGQRQPGDQVTQPRAGDGKTVAGVVAHLEGTEDRDPHATIVPDAAH